MFIYTQINNIKIYLHVKGARIYYKDEDIYMHWWTNIHQKMVRNVFLNIELILNDDIQEICEYDVQSLIVVKNFI